MFSRRGAETQRTAIGGLRGGAVAVSAPAKLILMGEHAAVYGRPALVAAAGLRLQVSLVAGTHAGARLLLSDSGVEETLSWSKLLGRVHRAREAWARYDEAPGPETFQALSSNGPCDLVALALGEAALELGESSQPSIELTLSSTIPMGSGFGSSAAAAVAVVLAYLTFRAAEADPARLHRVSIEVERRQHGSPSGVDNATVLYGGILWARRRASGGVDFEPVPTANRLIERLRVFGSGRPAEATGAVVAQVRSLRDREPARVDALFDRLAELTGAFRAELGREAERPEEVLQVLREAEACLEELGVVPEPVRGRVRRIEAAGGAAKVSGAGSLAGPGAGNLLVYHPEADTIDAWCRPGGPLAGLESYPVDLGVAGARVEGGAPSAAARVQSAARDEEPA
jgi:mevalonate kinase